MQRRVLIIGAGHNGLTTAFYLARAGFHPLVLERRPIVGGVATTEEIAGGVRGPALAHTLGPLRREIVRDMRLVERGVRFIEPDPAAIALAPAEASRAGSPHAPRPRRIRRRSRRSLRDPPRITCERFRLRVGQGDP